MYRTIDSTFWTDPVIKKLSYQCRYLFLYLITNPVAHVSGIYVLSRSTIAHETGLKNADVNKCIDTLSIGVSPLERSGIVRTDLEKDVIWVVNMLRYQGNWEKCYRSAAKHLKENLHKSFLIKEFLEKYPAVKRYYEGPDPDTLSIGVATPDTLCHSGTGTGTGNTPLTPLKGGEEPKSKSQSLTSEEFLNAWNAVAHFQHARALTSKRLRAFRARVNDEFWLTNWRKALEHAARLPFCSGSNDRSWIAAIDWFLRPDTVMRIIEGAYDRVGLNGTPTIKPADPEAKRKLLEETARRRKEERELYGDP